MFAVFFHHCDAIVLITEVARELYFLLLHALLLDKEAAVNQVLHIITEEDNESNHCLAVDARHNPVVATTFICFHLSFDFIVGIEAFRPSLQNRATQEERTRGRDCRHVVSFDHDGH